MKTYSGFGDFTLIFKIKAEINRSNLTCVKTTVFSEKYINYIVVLYIKPFPTIHDKKLCRKFVYSDVLEKNCF